MTVHVSAPIGSLYAALRRFLTVLVLILSTSCSFAVSCAVIKHNPPSEADQAFLAADFDKAATLYQAILAKQPEDKDATRGLVHALLYQQKVGLAADTVKSALANAPSAPDLITLRGEVELRQGVPWIAAQSAVESNKLDPCNPRTMLLIADLARLNSLYATASKSLASAHRIDPEDPEIRRRWIGTLSVREKIPEIEAYLAEPRGDDPDEKRHWQIYLDHLKKLVAEPRKSCHLVSQTPTADIPLTKLMWSATRFRAFGLDVKVNSRNARLEIDTGAGGLLISHSVAERLGLKAFSQTEMSGIGDQGSKPGYTAFADSIRIGDLEFQDCAVRVLDSHQGLDDVDGLIGMDVFSRFLVTLDYPMHKLLLGPLPPRPDETAPAAPALNTGETDSSESEAGTQPDKVSANPAGEGTAVQAGSAATPHHGPYDRYIAPEMKDYTQVYRTGHDLIIPATLNDQKLKLFIIDTGAWATTISPDAAREVTKVQKDSDIHVKGISGKVDNVYTANEITLTFGHMSQKAHDVVSFDTSKISKGVGMEISGFIGAKTLNLLTIHIDYRDGLVKFDYDPNRGYRTQ